MAQKKVEDILKRIALKYDLNWHVVEEIYNSQFKKAKLEINTLENPIIKIPNFGKFIPSSKKVEKKKINAQRKHDREANSNKSPTVDRI